MTVQRIVDHRDQSDTGASPPYHAAFMQYPLGFSPNGHYVMGFYGTDPTICVADTQTLTVVQNYNVGQIELLGGLPLWTEGTNVPICIGDNGSVWATANDTSGDIYEFPLGHLDTPSKRFTISGTDDTGHFEAYTSQAFTMPDSSTFLVLIASQTLSGFFPLDFHTWDGTTYTNVTTTWTPKSTFQDSNGDIWVCGVDKVIGDVSTAYFKRVTDVTGSSPYPADQTFTGLPVIYHDAVNYNATTIAGCFANGYFVGGWSQGALACSFLLSLALDGSGSVLTSDISANAPTGYSLVFQNGYIPPNQTQIVLPAVEAVPPVFTPSTRQRKFQFYNTADLTFASRYDLDDWEAGDDLASETSGTSVAITHDSTSRHYLYAKQTFIAQMDGVGFFQPDNPDEPLQNVGKLWLYALAGAAQDMSDVTDSSVTIRCWSFRLDGHEFYVLRLGPTSTLVFDRLSRQWSHWQSPGRTNWRAHVGQNWQGMATTLSDGGTDIVAGDDSTGILWRLAPTVGLDNRTDFGSDPFSRVATGAIALDGRDTLPVNALQITLALGNPAITGSSITLETSNDQGKSWLNHGTQTTTASDYTQVVEWRGLGSFGQPGLLARLTDDGATLRIGRAQIR
jgi:hypothetical protein